ncbi:methyltransferase domain-containing protein [Spirosoma sp. HMF4905]|uniref:Methyltransferase domain-containing protein n=1 Tax=Spirosoma arboris TaxID=2682092 RepID=A0A7K1SE06_9BACT|nr:class I SAM-dependent methyltransferase [Spirosoma arboris]MVM32035.1 methyltransferase domain-containing protein [Spirosoma arboris]
MNISIDNEWYETFFSGLNCEMWEKAVSAEWTTQEVDFLLSTLAVQPGAALLDIPCGYGRHTVELAKRGFTMTGFDISVEFLQLLRERIKAEQLAVQVIQGNILTAEIPGSFDGAYCMGNSFGYVNYEGMAVFVKKVAATLKPGSRFVINSGLMAESILPNFPKTGHYVLGDLTMDISNSYVVEESYMATELTYTKLGQSEVHYFKHYVYTLSEIKRLLERYGLRTIAVYNSTEKQNYTLGDRQIYLVAEKSY